MRDAIVVDIHPSADEVALVVAERTRRYGATDSKFGCGASPILNSRESEDLVLCCSARSAVRLKVACK